MSNSTVCYEYRLYAFLHILLYLCTSTIILPPQTITSDSKFGSCAKSSHQRTLHMKGKLISGFQFHLTHKSRRHYESPWILRSIPTQGTGISLHFDFVLPRPPDPWRPCLSVSDPLFSTCWGGNNGERYSTAPLHQWFVAPWQVETYRIAA